MAEATPTTTDPTTPQIQMPDLAAWQKALPYILALATAIFAAVGTGNWAIVGAEALKDVPNILMTLVPASAGLLGAVGTIWSALHNNRTLANKNLFSDLQSQIQNLKSKLASVDTSGATTFLTGLAQQAQQSSPNSPALLLPGFNLTLDPNVFGKPDSDARGKLVASIESFLANLEPKPATTATP